MLSVKGDKQIFTGSPAQNRVFNSADLGLFFFSMHLRRTGSEILMHKILIHKPDTHLLINKEK